LHGFINYDTERKQSSIIHNSNKAMKYLEINLTKNLKDKYTKNYKTQITKFKKADINETLSCVHNFKKLLLLKCLYYSKRSTESVQLSHENLNCILYRNRKNIKIHVESEKSLNIQSNLEWIKYCQREMSHFLMSIHKWIYT
jgi:hypothetical protein